MLPPFLQDVENVKTHFVTVTYHIGELAVPAAEHIHLKMYPSPIPLILKSICEDIGLKLFLKFYLLEIKQCSAVPTGKQK